MLVSNQINKDIRNVDSKISTAVEKAVLDNPDLPIEFIKDLLITKSQDKALAEPFIPKGS